MATRASGPRIFVEGMMGGIDDPEGVVARRYTQPTVAAKRDCTVLRKTGKCHTSGAAGGPYRVVVSFSWRYAHVKL